MKSASYNLRTSSVIARSRSWANTRFFWQIEGKVGNTFNLCTMTEGSIPDISLWLRAKTSWFSFRNVVSAWRIGGLARMLILVVHSSLALSRSISSNPSTSSTTVRYSSILMVCKWLSISNFAMQHLCTAIWSPRTSPTSYPVGNLIIRW